MKVKVVSKYRDKHTKALHSPGETLEMTNERYKEINSTSHGTFVKEIVEKKKPKK
jgi:hypothetical protein